MAEPALPESVIRAASEWFVRLGAEEAGAADEAAWRDWLAADARIVGPGRGWRRWAASSARCKRGPAWPRWNGLPPAAPPRENPLAGGRRAA